jgi:hypothetical protein
MAYSPFVFVVLYLCISFEAVHLIFSIFKKTGHLSTAHTVAFLAGFTNMYAEEVFSPSAGRKKMKNEML